MFGIPSVFYGDEAGLEGYHDPFCRRPFPWGREDAELLAHYKRLGAIRAENPVLAAGDFRILAEEKSAIVFERKNEKGHLIVAANRGSMPFPFVLPHAAESLLDGKKERGTVSVLPDEVKIWRVR